MALTVNSNLLATIVATDSNGNQLLNRSLGNSFLFAGVAGDYVAGQAIPNADTPITLPVSPTRFVYVKHAGTAGVLTVKWTPNGGAEVVAANLNPGAALILWDAGATTPGITSLKLNQSTASQQAEYYLGG